MRLWVVGEESGDPATWSIWSEYAIVVAETAEQAVALYWGDRGATGAVPAVKVAEIDMAKPQLLVTMPEPDWGDDL